MPLHTVHSVSRLINEERCNGMNGNSLNAHKPWALTEEWPNNYFLIITPNQVDLLLEESLGDTFWMNH